MQIMECTINSCEMLRVGVVVNTIMLISGILIIILMRISLENNKKLKIKRAKEEAKSNLVHIGYSAYLIAGSAFLGNLPFGDWATKNHIIFILVWSLVLMVLLFIEFLKSSISKNVTKFTLSRVIAIPCSCGAIWWVLIGATWPW